MEFIINKDATLPVLKMEIIQDGRHDYKNFHDKIQNANVYFSMADIETGICKVGKKLAACSLRPVTVNGCAIEEYYLTYQFTSRDTNKAGTYVGKFIIEFLDGSGTLIVPIREELYVYVLDGSIKK